MDIFLKETDTIWMLDIPGTWVAKDAEEATEVIESNTKYTEVMTCLYDLLVEHTDFPNYSCVKIDDNYYKCYVYLCNY